MNEKEIINKRCEEIADELDARGIPAVDYDGGYEVCFHTKYGSYLEFARIEATKHAALAIKVMVEYHRFCKNENGTFKGVCIRRNRQIIYELPLTTAKIA